MTNKQRDSSFSATQADRGLLLVAVHAVLAMAMALQLGCTSEPDLSWKEDVRLSDTITVTVTRRSQFRAPHEIGQTPGESWTSFELKHPVTGELVRYESRLRGSSAEMVEAGATSPTDPRLMQYPEALMLSGKDLFVVVHVFSSIAQFLGCPDPPLFLYRWEAGRWQRRPLEEIPQRVFMANLTVDPKGERVDIERSGLHLHGGQINASLSLSRQYDLTRMTLQSFDLPPTCKTCTMGVSIRKGGETITAGPFCTRRPRDWTERPALSN